ncbi:MAG: hypothetical protein IOD12_17725, partial [Silvanigrellales bacterium]|nr:hypothetical protein [Silvanigrellales bacterium]
SWPLEKVLETLKESAGSHFDPTLVDLFFENFEGVKAIQESFPVETPAPQPAPLKMAG